MTAYCICHNTSDLRISPGPASQCIIGDMHLYPIYRGNLGQGPIDLAQLGILILFWIDPNTNCVMQTSTLAHIMFPRSTWL